MLCIALTALPAFVPPPRVPAFGDPLGLTHASTGLGSPPPPAAVAVGLAALVALEPEQALAKGGEFGVFEGRIVSLAHPTVMATMYAASAYAAFTGWSWRRQRELGGEISALKAQQKTFAPAVADDGAAAAPSTQYTELGAQIEAMTATRKALVSEGLRDKHHQVGSVILGLGTAFAIEGPVNTYLRAQKLFPGPHLYAGAGVVVCWAMAASLVPLMGKGNDGARNAHMAFNILALGFFTWQLPTGWEITQKVVQFTKFP